MRTKLTKKLSLMVVARSIFKFFASLKLAIFVLVSLMIILATGTIIESLFGTDSARIVIYESWWFSVVLFLLGVNVACAALDRLPWKTKHIGFVVTHFGIITILVGSFVTQQTMVDGQLALAEGETDYRITLAEPLIYVFSEQAARDWILPIKKKAFVWSGNEKIKSDKTAELPFSLELLNYYPKSHLEENIVESKQGPGALKLLIQNSFVDQSLWLVENDVSLGRVPMGPAIFSFTDEFLSEMPRQVKQSPYLEFQIDQKNLRLPLLEDMSLPATLPLEGTSYQIKIERLFKRAIVEGKQLIENEDEKAELNPAVEFFILGDGIEEKHTAFTNFPDFPTMHGMLESHVVSKIFYRKADGGSKGESHELRFIKDKQGNLKYQVQNGIEVTTGEAKVGEEVSLGWMDLKFKIEIYYPFSSNDKRFEPIDNMSESETALPAVQIRIKNATEEKSLWLAQGLRENLEFGDDKLLLMYGQKRAPAPFRLQLKDFRIQHYPGTNQPASFESDVILKDDALGEVKEVTISMNQPLKHRGFNIYQSGYSLQPGEPEVSIFSVGRDPGIPFKYAGTIIMVVGIITMFFTRKFSTRAGKIG